MLVLNCVLENMKTIELRLRNWLAERIENKSHGYYPTSNCKGGGINNRFFSTHFPLSLRSPPQLTKIVVELSNHPNLLKATNLELRQIFPAP